jgi:hypothetical protein
MHVDSFTHSKNKEKELKPCYENSYCHLSKKYKKKLASLKGTGSNSLLSTIIKEGDIFFYYPK